MESPVTMLPRIIDATSLYLYSVHSKLMILTTSWIVKRVQAHTQRGCSIQRHPLNVSCYDEGLHRETKTCLSLLTTQLQAPSQAQREQRPRRTEQLCPQVGKSHFPHHLG